MIRSWVIKNISSICLDVVYFGHYLDFPLIKKRVKKRDYDIIVELGTYLAGRVCLAKLVTTDISVYNM